MRKDPSGENLVTTTEAAKRLGLERRTLEGWRSKGVGPQFVRVRRSVRYRPSDLEAWIEQGLRSSTSDPGPEAPNA